MLNIELERHADDIDVANEKAYQVITNGIEAVRAVLKPNNITKCVSCGEDIPTARKQANPACVRCIDCQLYFEQL